MPAAIPMTGVELDRGGDFSLTRQLYDRPRSSILSGQLVGGFRLPATRALAAELGVSRNTVIRVYDQLQTEGYIEVKTGSGATVARVLPESLINVPSSGGEPGTPHRLARPARTRPSPRRASTTPGWPGPSRLGELLTESPSIAIAAARMGGWTKAFQTGAPALDQFPTEVWARLVSRHLRDPSTDVLAYGSPAGHPPLRVAIAAYLGASRGVQCTAEQVIIVGGAQSGLDLAARTLLDPGRPGPDPGGVRGHRRCRNRGRRHRPLRGSGPRRRANLGRLPGRPRRPHRAGRDRHRRRRVCGRGRRQGVRRRVRAGGLRRDRRLSARLHKHAGQRVHHDDRRKRRVGRGAGERQHLRLDHRVAMDGDTGEGGPPLPLRATISAEIDEGVAVSRTGDPGGLG